jgi:hypothetical protein
VPIAEAIKSLICRKRRGWPITSTNLQQGTALPPSSCQEG